MKESRDASSDDDFQAKRNRSQSTKQMILLVVRIYLTQSAIMTMILTIHISLTINQNPPSCSGSSITVRSGA